MFAVSGCDWFKRKKSRSRISRSKSHGTLYHYVKPGETLWGIAKYYDVDLDYLISLNSISNPKNIRVGTRIFIPSNSSSKTKKSKKPVPKNVPRKKTRTKKKKNPVKKQSDNSDKNYIKHKGQFAFPVKNGRIARNYKESDDIYADGIDVKILNIEPVYAIYDGVVEYVGNDMEGYGTTAIISHPDDYYSLYAFLGKPAIEIGQNVKKNDIISNCGKKRDTDRYYLLHFQLRKGVLPQDPLKYYSNTVRKKFK